MSEVVQIKKRVYLRIFVGSIVVLPLWVTLSFLYARWAGPQKAEYWAATDGHAKAAALAVEGTSVAFGEAVSELNELILSLDKMSAQGEHFVSLFPSADGSVENLKNLITKIVTKGNLLSRLKDEGKLPPSDTALFLGRIQEIPSIASDLAWKHFWWGEWLSSLWFIPWIAVPLLGFLYLVHTPDSVSE